MLDIPDSSTSSEPSTTSSSNVFGVQHPLDCSQHPDALVCHKFTNDTSVKDVWIDPGYSCVPDAVFDSSEDAGRLSIGTKCGANSAGDFRFSWPTQTGELWVQYRFKQEEEYLKKAKDYGLPHPKMMVLWEGANSCTSDQFTQTNAYYRGFPQWYEACGSGAVNVKQADGDYDLQPGGDSACYYRSPTSRPPKECVYYKGEWATFTYYFDLDGSKHGGKPWVDAWIQYDGESRVKILSFGLNYAEELQHGFFAPYMTAKDPNIDHPVWHVWYQDFLVTARPLL